MARKVAVMDRAQQHQPRSACRCEVGPGGPMQSMGGAEPGAERRETSAVKLGFVGAGALGTLFGQRLAADNEVVLLERRRDVVDAVRRSGLSVDGESRAVTITSEPRALYGVQVLFVFVRATDTLRALRPFASELSPATAIVSLQNGLGNEEAIKTSLGGTISLVIGATTESALTVGPGERAPHRRRHDGARQRAARRRTSSTASCACWPRPGSARARAYDIRPHLWGKLIANAAINPVAALLDRPNGVVLTDDHAGDDRAVARAGSGDGRQRDADPAALHRSVVVRAHDRRADRGARQLDALRSARRRPHRGRFHQRRGRGGGPARRRRDAVQRDPDRAREGARSDAAARLRPAAARAPRRGAAFASALRASSSEKRVGLRSSAGAIHRYMIGTMNSVSASELSSPPITTIASDGALCRRRVPGRARAAACPATIAIVVMMIGRNRIAAASRMPVLARLAVAHAARCRRSRRAGSRSS